jgi:NADH-quinone oxidoreductase subunit M
MATWPILSVTTFLPIAGALFILLLRSEDEAAKRNARWVALWTTVITFIVSIFLITGFDRGNPGFQFVEDHPWLGGAVRYKLGVDGISLPFVILTTFLMPITILASWHVEKRVKEYMVLFLLLETLMVGTFSSLDIVFSREMQPWLWLAFFASFAVKLPMWPVHTWLPDAHVEAPTAGSVILAAVLLKMGGYGFLRFSLPMFPHASELFAPMMLFLSCVAIIYTSLVALMQEDIKKLIAYSSVAHMGFVTLGIFTFSNEGVQAGVFQMISHGIVSGALFLCVGVVYDRMHTREIAAYGGLVNRMPVYAAVFMLFTMANCGLPGTSGFVGELLALMAVFKANTWAAVFATAGVILSAAYALWLYRRVVFGALEKDSLKAITDLDRREIAILAPLVILTLLFGFYPAPVLDMSAAAVGNLVAQTKAALAPAKAALLGVQ